MKKTNTNAQAIVFAQAQDNKTVVATRDGKEAYLPWTLKQKNEKIYGNLGGKRREGVKYFCVDFPTAKKAKDFIAQAITSVSKSEYDNARKTEPKAKAEPKVKKVAPATAKGKAKTDDLVTVTLSDGTQVQVKASALGVKAPRKSKGDAPTTAPNAKTSKKAEPKAEKVATPKKAKGNADLTDAQKKALDKANMSILNRAASAYSIANGGEATTFKVLGKTEKDLTAYIPNAKVGMLKSKIWAKAVEMGITEDMLGF